MLLAAVFCLSLSSLFYEILLARFFSIAQWNHLSFMVISIALFGFAASGVFLNLLSFKNESWIKRLGQNKWISRIIFLFSISMAGSYLIVNAIPIDYFRIPFDYLQIVYVFLSFILFSLPFFFSGIVSALAYSSFPEKAGIIYFISMTGSTLGAIIPIPALPVLDIGGSILLSAFFPLILPGYTLKKLWQKTVWVLLVLSLAVFSFLVKNDPVVRVAPSPYKTLSQLLQLPGSRIEKTDHTLQGKIDLVTCPSIRFVPGLSLKYTSRLPAQYAVIKDADMQVTFYMDIYREESGDNSREFSQDHSPAFLSDFPAYTLPYAGYALVNQPKNILILQKGGGTAIPLSLMVQADHRGLPEIILCEEDPVVSGHIREAYKSRDITIKHINHREYIKNTSLVFDIIHIENWGSSIPGMASLNSEYLYTVEAMSGYIDILSDAGVLIIPRKLLLPPSDSLRMFLSALQALKEKGIDAPEKHIMLIKHWDIYTLLLSKEVFAGERLAGIKEFCADRGFDLLYYHGMTIEETELFVKSVEPFHYNEIQNIIKHSGDIKKYLSGYFLDIAPRQDNRPYHNKYIKWGNISAFFKSTGQRFYTLILSGEIIVWIVLIVAFLVYQFHLVIAAVLIQKKAEKISPARIIYFLAIGAGFMFMELAFIKEFTLLAADPVVSFSFVLCIILIFSGIGGYMSSGLTQKQLYCIFIILILLSLVFFISSDWVIHMILTLPALIRFILMGVLLLPLSFCLGIPFPTGIKDLLSYPGQRAYSWAANGCTSVLASIVSVLFAMSFGIQMLFLLGGLSYGIAFAMVLIIKKKQKSFSFLS